MRVAMFTETWYPTRDGVVTSLTSFRKGLEALGHEVFIFAAGSEDARRANTDERVRIYTGPPWSPYPEYHLAVRPGPTRKLLRSLGVDLVHSHGTATMGVKAVRAARLAGLPFVLTYHTRVEDATGYITRHPKREALLRRLIWTWQRWYFRQCDGIVTPSEAVKHDLLREAPRALRRLFVVPSGIDVGRFAQAEGAGAREKYALRGRVVLSVGRVAWEKNLETLLGAAELVRQGREDVTFAVAGKGPALAHFKQETARRGLTEAVRFLGFVPDEDLPALYASADAFLMASTFETQGIALVEAMASGLPVAAADTGGPTHFLRSGENGILFEGRSPQACADAVVRALEADGTLRQRARETAARFSVESQARALVDVYANVLAARASA